MWWKPEKKSLEEWNLMMSDILKTIREKRADAIADMEEPIIYLTLEETNQVLQKIDDLEGVKKTLMNDLAVVNLQLGKK